MKQQDGKTRSIITSASSKFFPSLLNLIGSIKKNSPDHPHIYVYDLGLFPTYRAEIKSIPNVTLVPMPRFCSFWRKCYTWKTYIFNNPFTDVTLYLDAGNEVLEPLDVLFGQIERDGYIAVEQTVPSSAIIPKEYISLFGVPQETLGQNAITAGIFGFDRRQPEVQNLLSRLHDASLSGLCLGYSRNELWKNKGVNKNFFIRDCSHFRHDTTLLTILLHTRMPNLLVEPAARFSDIREPRGSGQVIHNLRMNYSTLGHTGITLINPGAKKIASFNRLLVSLFFFLKKINRKIKFSIRTALSSNIFAETFGKDLNAIMDSFHDYPGEHKGYFSNIRLYHHLKASICKSFIERNAMETGAFLDAGAGTGPYSKIASGLYAHVYAYEYNAEELDKARVNLSGNAKVEFGAVDLRNIPLADASVDVLVCSEVLEHIPNEPLAAQELFRVLKPGGAALISMPNKNSLFYKRISARMKDLVSRSKTEDMLGHPDWEKLRHVSFSSGMIEGIAEKAGFTIVAKRGANLLPMPTPIRKLLMQYIPLLFYIWTTCEQGLSRLFPRFCSFYFIELRK